MCMIGLIRTTWFIILENLTTSVFSASPDMSVCSNAYISQDMNLIAQHEHIKNCAFHIC